MKIVVSNTSHGAYKGVVDEIRKHLDASDECIILAPDRFTAFVERGIISTLELESTFGIEVMSFTRLASKFVGKDIKKCLTPEGSVMLISKVVLDVKDELSYYKNVANADGFASELYAALTALRNSGMDVERLKAKAEAMPKNTPLRAKLFDIALVYNEYLKQLGENHSDSTTRLNALAEFLAEHPESVAGKRFYCTDIYEFSVPELEILKKLDKYAKSLTIGVTSGYDNPNKRIYPDRVIAKLQSICEDKAEIVHNDEKLIVPVDAISKWLFSYSLPKTRAENKGENGDKKVFLRVTKDRYDEILRLALDISRHVREGGRYKDIEVFASDIKDYQSDLKAIFSRYNIPFFIDEKELLSEQTKVRFLLNALNVVKSGFRSGEVLDFVKNPLFYSSLDFGEEEVFLFENYVLKYSIEYSRFLSPFELSEKESSNKHNYHKKNLNIDELDDKTRFLIENDENVVPEKVRRALVNMLAPINFKGSVATQKIVDGAKLLLESIDEAWRCHVKKLAEISKFYEKCAEQVDEKLEAVFDEIDDVLVGERTVGEFEMIFSSMIKTLKIALVPTYLDCVFVGSFDSRFMGGKDVYILGAVNGKLPGIQTGGVILNTRDEELLEEVGVEVSPTSYQKIMTGMYAVCDLMKKPHGKLVVSYPEIADGAFLKPSVVISELKGILSDDGKPIEEERIDFEHTSKIFDKQSREEIVVDMFATKHGAYHEILRNAIPTVSQDAVSNRILPEELGIYSAALETVDADDKAKLISIDDKPERIVVQSDFAPITSVSRLEKFYACPYQHYFAYVLALKKRQEGEFLGTENGTILHSVLEQLFVDIRDGKVDESSLDKKSEEYFDKAIAEGKFEYLFEKPHTKRLLLRVKSECKTLAHDMYKLSLRSDFKPYLMEAVIGEAPIKPMSIKVGENEIKFKGVIDRVDIKDDDFLVIDYKTYNPKLNLIDLYYGEKIQLYIYMKAVKDSLNKRPAGLFYFPITNGFVKEEKKKYSYQGQFVNDVEVLKSIDNMFAESYADSVLPITPTGKLMESTFVSPEMLDTFGDYALKVATKGEEAIEGGFIKPLPMREKCQTCDFRDMCEFSYARERAAGKVTLASFENLEGENE